MTERTIEWPESWSDRGAIRRFDDTKNYPAAHPGVVYAQQIATYLNYPIERVLKYAMLKGPDDTTLPNWWIRDRYDSYYCAEEYAVQIVERIRFHRSVTPHAKPRAAGLPADHEAARARKLAKLRQNSEAMLERFLVVTAGHNATFLEKLGVTKLENIDVDAVLRTENIRLVSLDNPERWSPDGQNVVPKKFLALHPSDVAPAIKALKESVEKLLVPINEGERTDRSTVVWLPQNDKGFRHPDPARTVYPPRITRLVLDMRNMPYGGWAVLRGWGTKLDQETIPINGCEVTFDAVPEKDRFHALLDLDDVEEILLLETNEVPAIPAESAHPESDSPEAHADKCVRDLCDLLESKATVFNAPDRSDEFRRLRRDSSLETMKALIQLL